MLSTVLFNFTNYQPWEERDREVQKQKTLFTGFSLSWTYACCNFDVYTGEEPEPRYLQKLLQ